MERYEEWCTGAHYDEATKQELMSIRDDDSEIRDRFYKDLSFGTGGLRGVIGAGTNRMNIYTVARATQGLANYILKRGGENKGVAIAFDSRHMSPEFAEVTALCLNANRIRTYRFETLRPTPELSFAVRELGCVAGVVITASHNPAEYNGYKVYWEDGAQITAPLDQEIINEVNSVTDYASIKTMDRDRAEAAGLFNVIGEKIDNRYMEELEKLVLSPESIRKIAPELTIVYTPIHGTGNLPVRRILNNLGFTRVHVVPEQELPDGSFSTVTYPNPEDPKAFTLALKLAQEVDADIVLATDPDADRLGVYAKDTRNGEYVPFSGNMSGMLIAEYQFEVKRGKGLLPVNGALVTTIVSSNMAKEVAKEYGVNIVETLTGFKYIGEQIKFFEQDKSYEYLFGFEESYGCLVGTHARDKDAIAAVMALCEAAAYYKERGLTLWDQMLRIYEKYGYYNEDLKSITLKGADGADKIKSILADIRKNPPRKIGEFNVLVIRDYKKNETLELVTGEKYPTGLPKSDVLYFDLDKDSWCCVRPSGTEPKIKFYLGVKGESLEASRSSLKGLSEALSGLVN
ncbi:phospho-sugar mutase [Youngiibacter multivorans]|uniref:Phosphoglucomutase n=1 Tax=Youngiibacter multivorans TaxID=937251 RepID=A0ABS4G6F6_9CLOT|nr:phospho-sugar mutase [Youngiibacter multivorans]MBP1920108.1 phosphoglucomutase [Youngiibacter multivorans]